MWPMTGEADSAAPRARRRFRRLRQLVTTLGALLGAAAALDFLDPSHALSSLVRVGLYMAVFIALYVALNWLLRAGIHLTHVD